MHELKDFRLNFENRGWPLGAGFRFTLYDAQPKLSMMNPFISLWITERSSGICIIEAHFREGVIDAKQTDLLSGFIVALLEIADEIKADGIEHVQLGNARIIYDVNPKYVIVCWVDPDAKPKAVARVIEKVRERFDANYAQKLTEKGVKVDDFDRFHEDIDQIWEGAGHRTRLKFLEGRKIPSLEGARATVSRGMKKLKGAAARGRRALGKVKKSVTNKVHTVKERRKSKKSNS